MPEPVAKYKFLFSESEIDLLMHLTGSDPGPASLSLYRKFDKQKRKITSNLIQPAYVNTGRKSLDESLGFSPDSSIETLLETWKLNPSILNPKQLEQVSTYRWENDLMSPQEMQEYENGIISPFPTH